VPRWAGGRAVGRSAVVALLVLVAACSRGDDPTVEGDLPTTEPSEATTSTTRATSTTIEAACPPVERYVGDEDTEDEGDVDGDGRADFVQSFPTSTDSTTVTLLVDLAAGGGALVELPSEHLAPTILLGTEVLDARADGREVLWVRVGAGASTTILGLYHLDGCSLEPATFENGDLVELPIGGTVGTASGARCGSLADPAADLLVFESTNISGREYEVVTTEYLWQDGQLVRSQDGAPTVTRSDDLSEVTGFRCGDLSL
jgi:hypothetical protein